MYRNYDLDHCCFNLLLLQSSECSPLSTACKCRAVASAEILLQYGANPNGSSSVSINILHVLKCSVVDIRTFSGQASSVG